MSNNSATQWQGNLWRNLTDVGAQRNVMFLTELNFCFESANISAFNNQLSVFVVGIYKSFILSFFQNILNQESKKVKKHAP